MHIRKAYTLILFAGTLLTQRCQSAASVDTLQHPAQQSTPQQHMDAEAPDGPRAVAG